MQFKILQQFIYPNTFVFPPIALELSAMAVASSFDRPTRTLDIQPK
jgi:hypothetical protein